MMHVKLKDNSLFKQLRLNW